MHPLWVEFREIPSLEYDQQGCEASKRRGTLDDVAIRFVHSYDDPIAAPEESTRFDMATHELQTEELVVRVEQAVPPAQRVRRSALEAKLWTKGGLTRVDESPEIAAPSKVRQPAAPRYRLANRSKGPGRAVDSPVADLDERDQQPMSIELSETALVEVDAARFRCPAEFLR